MKYLLIILSFTSLGLSANNNDSLDFIKINNQSQQFDNDSINKNSIFIEALGCGIFGSINYERIIFSKLNNAINCRIGLATIPMYGYYNIVPLLINYQTSINKSISFEIGFGTRFINYKTGSEHASYGNSFDIIGNTGFRFLIKKHLLLKIDLTPQFTSKVLIIGLHGNPIIYFGFSVGYSF